MEEKTERETLTPAREAKKMKVSDLKAELERRDIEPIGKKAELVKNLQELFDAEATAKTEKKRESMADHPEQLIHDAHVEELSGHTVEQLKHMLRENGAKLSGVKAEQVERVVDFKMFGVPVTCTKSECSGTPEVNYPQKWGHKGQGAWHCRGHFSSSALGSTGWINCGWRGDHHERADWSNPGKPKYNGDDEWRP